MMSVNSVTTTVPTSPEEAVAPSREEQAVKAAKDFESFFVGSIFQEAFESMPQSEFMNGGPGGSLYQSLFIQEVATSAVQGSGLGLSEQIAKIYSHNAGSGQDIENKGNIEENEKRISIENTA